MRPRHDARLVPAALLAYACAGLVSGEVLTPSVVRHALVVCAVAVAAAVAIAVLACLAPSAARARGIHLANMRAGRGPGRGRGRARVLGPGAQSMCAHAAIAGVIVIIAALSAQAHMAARWDGGFEAAVGPSTTVNLIAIVKREPAPLSKPGFNGEARHRAELAVRQWRPAGGEGALNSRWRRAAAPLEVMGGEPIAALEYGDVVEVTTTLTRVHGERAVAIGWDAEVAARHPATGMDGMVATLRDDFRRATAGLSTPVKGLSRGMVIGDTRAMPDQQREDMRVSGLTHLTAVSGAHFAVVAVLLHGILRRMKTPRVVRAVAAALGMAGFACLVFPDASVVRALAMALVGAVAVAWGRPAHALPALALAVIALVCVDPFVSLEAGFALSVSAVAAIILWAPRLRVIFGAVMPPTLAMLVSVPLAAQAACAPILILLEPRVSVYAVVANLVAASFAAPVTLVGLCAVLVGPLSHAAATWAAWLASTAAWPVAAVARIAASTPGATVSWPAGLVGGLTLAVLTAVVMWWTAERGSTHAKALATALALALVVVAAHADQAWQWASPVPDQWAIVACDVGQGDMMMLRVGVHSAAIIDTGPGDGSASACMRRYGVSEVPLLILTHPHADHDGGISEVLATAHVGTAWIPQVSTLEGFDPAARRLTEAGVDVGVPEVGERWNATQLELTVRQARPVSPAPPVGTRVDGTVLNDASLVVTGVVHGVSVLALGDVEDDAQRDLESAMGGAIAVDVVKVAHHGSRVQDAGLAARIEAAVAIVSVGAGNTYGHPSDKALALYGQGGTRVIRTDTCADVVVWRDRGLRVASHCQ